MPRSEIRWPVGRADAAIFEWPGDAGDRYFGRKCLVDKGFGLGTISGLSFLFASGRLREKRGGWGVANPASVQARALEQYRDYLRLLASQHLAARFRGKVDPSGIVQQTLWEAHRELVQGIEVPSGEQLAWLRRILANNLADEVRRFTAEKRNVGREVSLQQAIEQSSQQLEVWLARDFAPCHAVERDELLLRLAGALARLSADQREAIILHYWSGRTLIQIANELDRSRDAVAGLIKRGLRQLRNEMADSQLGCQTS
jgi:RNA polymerase sigma-70 factor (ECF subfamily)